MLLAVLGLWRSTPSRCAAGAVLLVRPPLALLRCDYIDGVCATSPLSALPWYLCFLRPDPFRFGNACPRGLNSPGVRSAFDSFLLSSPKRLRSWAVHAQPAPLSQLAQFQLPPLPGQPIGFLLAFRLTHFSSPPRTSTFGVLPIRRGAGEPWSLSTGDPCCFLCTAVSVATQLATPTPFRGLVAWCAFPFSTGFGQTALTAVAGYFFLRCPLPVYFVAVSASPGTRTPSVVVVGSGLPSPLHDCVSFWVACGWVVGYIAITPLDVAPPLVFLFCSVAFLFSSWLAVFSSLVTGFLLFCTAFPPRWLLAR